jgi:hypothetical protein
MPKTSQQKVRNLNLDLRNYRTVPQKREEDAIRAMITIKPDRFYAVMESIIENGYMPTENIIVVNDGSKLIVKEGNRRIAALKLIHGHYKAIDFGIPANIIDKISKLEKTWEKENSEIPCAIFDISESERADKVVALSHGKGEKASRDPWSSVARARHNRDVNGVSEPALDLLEKYLEIGSNLNDDQRDRWSGEFPLSILQESLRLLFIRYGFSTIAELVANYPKSDKKPDIENLIRDIGLDSLTFKIIRDPNTDFAVNYGCSKKESTPPTTKPDSPDPNNPTTPDTNDTAKNGSNNDESNGDPNGNGKSGSQNSKQDSRKRAYASNDPRSVIKQLKDFIPKGDNREKVVTLKDEMTKLKIAATPIAFCFLLRSLFEISARAYSKDHNISLDKPPKKDKSAQQKTLLELLKEIKDHLISHSTDRDFVKVLHGAITELDKPSGILSVTSMNNLVHNPFFTIQPNDICTLFSNIFPLLKAMN